MSTPIVAIIATLFPNPGPVLSSPAIPPPPPPPPPPPAAPLTPAPTETLQTLNPIRSFPQYMDIFQKTYPTLEEMTFRETVFLVRE